MFTLNQLEQLKDILQEIGKYIVIGETSRSDLLKTVNANILALTSPLSLKDVSDFQFKDWHINGAGMMTRRIYLPADHPESVPSLFLEKHVPIESVLGEDWRECFEDKESETA